MKRSQKNLATALRIDVTERLLVLYVLLALCCVALTQQGKSAPAKPALTGSYEGTAKNNAGEVIPVTFELTEKEGAVSGMIRSSHGDFTITGGSHHGEDVTIEFDADGSTGTISLKTSEDKLAGTWSAGDDGGPVDVKKVATQGDAPKGKS
jgi:hypothetical protein